MKDNYFVYVELKQGR